MTLLLIYIGVAVLAISFPAAFTFYGILIGIRWERTKVLAYLRALDGAPSPLHLATRIEARAHRGVDADSLLDDVDRRRR